MRDSSATNCGEDHGTLATKAAMLTRISALREQMRRLSRQIGTARATGKDVHEFLARMKHLSAERKQLEARLKEHDDTSVERTNRNAPRAELFPNDQPEAARARHTNERIAPGPDFSLTTEGLTDAEWDAYVLRHPRASPYHLTCWRRIVEESFRHPARYVAARDANGELAGVLPAFRQSSRIFGRFLTSMPFLNYGGALGDSTAVEDGLMRGARDLALTEGCCHAEFRDEVPRAGWPARTEKVALRLALPRDSVELWQSLPSKVRAQVRRANREQPGFEVGGPELLGEFYRVFSRNMRDLGTPVYAPSFFQNVVELSGPECRVVVLRAAGVPVSGGILVGFRGRLEIPWASTLRDANPLGLNMQFYWSILEYAVNMGYQSFDFGRSTHNSGTYRFKRQWGATPVPLYWHYGLARAGDLPRLNPENPKYRLAVAGWRKLPLALANRLGPRLSRNLP
jgi:serine/alanine adding enzyme